MSDGTSSPEPSIFSAVEHPAKRSALSASERDFPMIVVNWPLSICDLLHTCSLAGSSGRMWWESCTPTEDGTLEPSCERWGTAGIGGATESWTLDISESPSPADESFSWRSVETIMQTGDIPPQHYLSDRACAGIARRNLRRGMKLPDALHQEAARRGAICTRKKASSDSQKMVDCDGSHP